MTKQDVELGCEVYWDTNPDDTGTVTEMNDTGCLIDWANGQLGWVDFRDMGKIHRTSPDAKTPTSNHNPN